ncbi:hypothetical protein HDU78_008549 [Chytriomyces hyalinus]|nr:hypothetical protein HDU78_008549 [Chytriomyces hyalinus]
MSTASAPASPPNTSAGSNAPTLPPTSNGGDNAPSPSPAPPTSNVPTVRTSRPSPPSPSSEPQPQPSPSPPPPPSPSPPPPPPPPPPSPSPDPPPPPPPPPPSPSPNPRPTAASPPPPPPPPPEPAPSPAPPPPPNPSPNPPPEIPAPPPPQSQSPPIPPSDPANNPPSREPASSDAPINQQVQQQQGEVSSSFAASNAAIDGAAAATTTARDSPMPTTTDVSSTLVSPTASFESISGVVSRSAGRTSTTAAAGKFTGTMTAAFNASSTVDFGGAISGSDANGAAGVSIGVVFAIVAGCVAAAALLVTLAVWWIRRDNNKTGGGGGVHKQGAISRRKDVSSVVFWSKWNKNEKPEMQQPFLVADGGAAGAGAGAVDENASSTLAVPPLLPIESLKEVEHVVVGNSVLGQIEEEDEDEEDAEEEEEEDTGLMEVAPLSATESFASTNPLASQDTSRPLTEQQPQPQVAVASEAITTEVSKKPSLLDNIPQPVLAASSTSPKITTLSVAADTPRTRRKLLGFLPRITAPRKQSATEISPSTKVQAATTATTPTTTTSSAAISRAYQMHRPQPTIHQTPADTAAAALPSNLVPPAAYEQFQQDLALQYMYGLTNEQQQQLHQHQQHQYFSQYQMMHQTAPELSGMSQEYINSWWQAFYQQNPVLAQEYYEAALKAQREGRL